MKKFFNWFWIVVYIVIPIYFIFTLVYSMSSGIKITELLDYDWLLFFFVFEMWGMSRRQAGKGQKQTEDEKGSATLC